MLAFVDEAAARGVKVQVFGLTKDNARTFWNCGFLTDVPPLDAMRATLERTCDVRLPARLTPDDCTKIAHALTQAAATATTPKAA